MYYNGSFLSLPLYDLLTVMAAASAAVPASGEDSICCESYGKEGFVRSSFLFRHFIEVFSQVYHNNFLTP